jgi:hypothetical protein
MREEERDLSFLDFGGTRRHPRGTRRVAVGGRRKPPRVSTRDGREKVERETGALRGPAKKQKRSGDEVARDPQLGKRIRR